MYSIKPVSLRTAANLIQAQKTFISFQVRDISVLKTVSGYSELLGLFGPTGPQPSQTTLLQLSQALGSGADIKYVSKDYRRVSIAGPMDAFVSTNAYRLDWLTGVAPMAGQQARPQPRLTTGQWLAVAGAVIAIGGLIVLVAGGAGVVGGAIWVTQGALSAQEITALVGAGVQSFGTGLGIGVGLGSAFSDSTGDVTPCVCPDAGASPAALPVDAGTAASGVYTVNAPDVNSNVVSNAYDAPNVDVSSLPADPSSTTDPGNPTFGDPGSSKGKDSSDKDKESSDKEKESSDKDKESSDKDKESSDKDKESSDKDKESSDKGKESSDQGKSASDFGGEIRPPGNATLYADSAESSLSPTSALNMRAVKAAKLLFRTPVI